MNKEIEIPEGHEAKIEGNKVVFVPKESEDERVRAHVVLVVKDWWRKIAEVTDDGKWPTEEEMLAYLEKQKEQKPIAESKRLANEVIEYLTKCGYSPVLKDDSKKEHFHIDIPRHEDDFWHSEEYKHCRSVLGEYYMEGDYGGDTYTLYVWREKKEQKPTEWSDEDEMMLEAFLHKLEVCNLLSNKEVTWAKLRLKSLRPQPHWKPSEEQIDILDKVYHYLWVDRNATADMQDGLGDFIDELKSL